MKNAVLISSCAAAMLSGCLSMGNPCESGSCRCAESAATETAGTQEMAIPVRVLFEEYFQNGQPSAKFSDLLISYIKSNPLPEKPTEAETVAFANRLNILNNFNNYRYNNEMQQLRMWVAEQLAKADVKDLIAISRNNGLVMEHVKSRIRPEDKKYIFDILNNSNDNSNYNLVQYYKPLITEADKADIITLLPRYGSQLGEEVRRFGLQKEAFTAMRGQLENNRYGNTLQLCIEFCPRDEFDSFCSEYLRSIQLRENNNDGVNYNAVNAALQMAKAGHLKSLRYLLGNMKNMRLNNHSQFINGTLALTPCRSQDEAIAWYNQNKDNIFFDADTFTYQAKPAPAPTAVDAPAAD